LLGPADGREWAHKKLVAVLPAVAEQDATVLRDKSKFMLANMCINKQDGMVRQTLMMTATAK